MTNTAPRYNPHSAVDRALLCAIVVGVIAGLMSTFGLGGWVPLTLVIGIAYLLLSVIRGARHYEELLEKLDEERELAAGKVDPWALQEHLMQASDQRLPRTPRLHTGMLLYAALQMEELGEELEAISNAMLRHGSGGLPLGYPTLTATFAQQGTGLQHFAITIRNILETLEWDTELSSEDAKEIFDGCTDVAVVTCGFALSAGFPGPAGYAEVADSNLSKVDPETGKIKKTPDGKWIKGPNYYKPDLARILAMCRAPSGGAGSSGFPGATAI